MMVLSTNANKTLPSFNAQSRRSLEESKVCSFSDAELAAAKIQDMIY